MKRRVARGAQAHHLTALWRHGAHLWDISLAAPQVIAHRSARMLAAGPHPSARDRREFIRMGQEKVEAFGESMLAMSMRLWQAQVSALMGWVQQAMGWWSGAWSAPHGGGTMMLMPSAHLRQEQQRALHTWSGIVGGGMAPVHRRVTANARRLARTRLSTPSKRSS